MHAFPFHIIVRIMLYDLIPYINGKEEDMTKLILSSSWIASVFVLQRQDDYATIPRTTFGATVFVQQAIKQLCKTLDYSWAV